MKELMMRNQNFWSGVINYIRASANNAEALKPWDFRVPQEVKTVLVYSTSVESPDAQASIAAAMDGLVGQNNWTIDLEDVDKVLRVVCAASKGTAIVALLRGAGFDCETLR